MKRATVLLVLWSALTTAFGQGQFVFNNRVPPDVDAPFLLFPGPGGALSGNAYTVQLLGGPLGAPVSNLVPLGTTDFRTGNAAGYVNPLTVTVPGVVNGQTAEVLLRVFQGAAPSGLPFGTFGPYTITVAEAPNVPLTLPLGTTPFYFCLDCPEPSSIFLLIGGLAGMVVAFRRGCSLPPRSGWFGPVGRPQQGTEWLTGFRASLGSARSRGQYPN